MTESAIRNALEKTSRFADRQKLLKELWKIKRASASQQKNQRETSHSVARTASA